MREDESGRYEFRNIVRNNNVEKTLFQQSSQSENYRMQEIKSPEESLVGLGMGINIFGTQLSLVRGPINMLNAETSFSKGFYCQALVIFKQSNEKPSIYPYSQVVSKTQREDIQKFTFPVSIISSDIQPYKKIMIVCLDLYRRSDYEEEKRENYMMQKVLTEIFMHAKEKKIRSLTISYLWSEYFEKGSKMMLKFIKRYLLTDLSLGKPVPFDKINILVINAQIYDSMSTIFMEEMFKNEE